MKPKAQFVLDENIIKIGEKLAKKAGFGSYKELVIFWTVQAGQGNLLLRNAESEVISDEELEIIKKLDKEFQESEAAGTTTTTKSIDEHFRYLGI